MPTLNWIGKDKVINHHLDVPFRILDHSYSYNCKEKIATINNKIIHGDNLEALKALLPLHEGKINCIYIDPPYNTGNEGWIYNDSVNDPRITKWLGQVVGKESEDLSRHDKWLCMMYPRLKLLHKLLDDNGAIFISINEDEQAVLKMLLDEIFGSNNYLTMFSIKLRHEERILKGDKDFHEVTEQLYLYRKSSKFKPQKKEYDNTSLDEYIYEIVLFDDTPEYYEMDGKSVKSYSPYQFNIIKRPPNPNCLKKINIRGTLKEGNSSGRFYMKHFDPLVKEKYGYLFSVPNMGDDGIGSRYFLLPKDAKKANGDYFQGVPLNRSDIKEVPYPNYFDFTDEFNRVGYQGGVDFRFGKKPIEFLMKIFEIAGLNKISEGIILDSFSGSGSTAEAVLNFNIKYQCNLSFVLIEMMDYAETITAARVKNVIDGYSKVAAISSSFDYYELGAPMFSEDGLLNEEVGTEKIRQYIYYTETKTPLPAAVHGDNESFLASHNGTAYYFHYLQDEVTTLDHGFLATMRTKAEQYVIYADNCLLTRDYMMKHHIVFKKIPRDITRF